MIKNTLIIALIVLAIYLYYQNRKLKGLPHSGNSGTCFSFEEEQLKEQVAELQSNLTQSQILQESNQTKLQEQTQEILNLKNRLNVYEGVSASGSGENEKLKEVLNERDELKRQNQNLTLDKEKLEEELKDYQDLETEKDEAIREKQTADQEVLSLSNKLKLKNQEVQNKDEQITRIKKEKSDKDIALNKTIKELKEKNKQLEERHKKREKLLDEEQLEAKKLEEQKEKLQEQIEELKRSKSPMPGEFPEENNQELIQQHQEQLKKINLLFDDNATNYQQIDFNGLYSLLETVAEEQKKKKKTNRTSTNIQPKT
jgi:chromosome segregation ATPase